MIHRRFRGERASELFPVLAHDSDANLFLLDDQTLGFGWLCEPLSYVDQALFDRLLNLVNLEWPDGTLLQVCLWTSPDIMEQMAAMENLRLRTADPLLRESTRKTAAFLRDSTRAPIPGCGEMRVRDLQVLVLAKLRIAAPTPRADERHDAQELQATARQVLVTTGLRPLDLTADMLVRTMQVMLNWGDYPGWRDRIVPECDPHTTIAQQLLDYDAEIKVDADGVTIGGQRFQSLSVKRFPERTSFGVASRFLGDPFSGARGIPHNCLITLNLVLPDPETARLKLTSRSQWAAHQSAGPLTHYLPALSERKGEYDRLFERLDAGDRSVLAYLGMVLMTAPRDASAAVANARTYFRELGFQLLPDRFFCLPLLLNCLPFGVDAKAVANAQRYRTMSAAHAATLMPVFGDWKGTGAPVVQFLGRNGQMIHFDPFSPDAANFNGVIAASSGAGKSFLANELISTNLAVGGRCWVIDVGRSYEKLCESLGGQFLEFKDAGIVVNPFELVECWDEESDMIAGLVEAMASPGQALDDFRRAGLKRVLKRLWTKHGNTLSVDLLAHELLDEDDQRIRDVGNQLFSFTTEGEYGRYFHGQNTVRFDADLVVLELEELKGRKHLQQVVLLCLIYQIQRAMYLGGSGEGVLRKLLLIDEAWDLLTAGAVGHFVMEAYRRFRKYGGAAFTVTQSLADLYENPNGRAIASNSAHTLLLRQSSQLIDQLQAEKRLPLSDGGVELFKTVHTSPGRYSEIMLVSDAGGGICRLVVDRFRQLLYSTKAQEVAAINARRAAGMTVAEAIDKILEESRAAAA